jgi:DNA repair exonuclease SbcCD ATPase subunit
MTNATTGAPIAQPGQEPLGTLLVKRGLITDEQLQNALAEQEASGAPLGKIVVERGYVRPEVIAQALATQHGGLLKTEYGFATGFGAGSASDEPVPAPPVSAGAPAPTALRSELAHASEDAARLRAENERLAQRRAELEQRLASETRRAAALERELAERAGGAVSAAAPTEWGELEKQVAKEARKVSTLEAAVAARDAAIAEFKETAESWQRALAERDTAIRTLVAARDEALAELAARASTIEALESAAGAAAPAVADTSDLDELRAELARTAEACTDAALEELHEAQVALAGREAAIGDLVAKLAAATAPTPERWAGADRHALFFRGAEGYELLERSGPPPAAGDVVPVPGGPRVVARVAAGPGTPLPCAYLLD